ncbi:MAG TPA: FAD-dependent oxidoreductase [Pilimelia sp.]|nr:FAD-dependent oxidoreductase [Pilimelia sp.]
MSRSAVVVVGAGVVGLTTAVALAEGGHPVTVLADEIPGHTSLAAGAVWGPYLVGPRDKVDGWGATTRAALTALAQRPDTGVRLVDGVEATRAAPAAPGGASLFPAARPCRTDELPPGFRGGWCHTAPVVDMPRYLDHLRRRLHAAGGRLVRRHVTDLAELAGTAPVVVNCAGIGAHRLAGDASVRPVRGQLVVVENPGVDRFFVEDPGPGDGPGAAVELTYYLPHRDTVVLGGVAVPDDWSGEPDPAVAAGIIERCAAVEPLLGRARILAHRVGLRPARPQVRLEAERSARGLLVHNYGHGGAGVSLSWGCAADIRALLGTA